MAHFCTTLQYYIMFEVLKDGWGHFVRRMSSDESGRPRRGARRLPRHRVGEGTSGTSKPAPRAAAGGHLRARAAVQGLCEPAARDAAAGGQPEEAPGDAGADLGGRGAV